MQDYQGNKQTSSHSRLFISLYGWTFFLNILWFMMMMMFIGFALHYTAERIL